MNTAILDGDMIVYRAAFGSEVEVRWDDDIFTLHMSLIEAHQKVDELVETILKKTDTHSYKMAFSDSHTFRHELEPSYKANRKDKRKPLGLKALIQEAFDKHNGIKFPNIEADDLIGILCTANPDFIAVSGDKDFGTLPCKWYNFLKDEMHDTSEEEANKWHLIQALAGDSVDGYGGCKGIGVITAKKLLDKKGYNWQSVVDIYESKDMTEGVALLTARLAYILRDKDYDTKTHTIKELWKPTI